MGSGSISARPPPPGGAARRADAGGNSGHRVSAGVNRAYGVIR